MNNPINESKSTCVPTSSNCVKWQGPNIDWMSLCRDASITEVILQLSDEIKIISNALDISSYEMDCLDLGKCGPKSFDDLVQLIINKLCSLNKNDAIDINTLVVDIIPECFVEYNDGDEEASIATYANLIAQKVCENIDRLNELEEQVTKNAEAIVSLSESVEELKQTKQDKINIVGCNNETNIESVLQDTVNKVCEYTEALGTIDNLSKDNKCNISYYPYYLSDPDSNLYRDIETNNTVSDNIKNIWLVLCDLRKKVYELSVKASDLFVNIESYITCDGTIKAKISSTYDQDSYNIISYRTVILGTHYTRDVIGNVNTGEWFNLYSEKEGDEYQLALTVGYKLLDESKTRSFYFDSKRIVTEATITEPETINEYRVINFVKNVSDKTVTIKRTIGTSASTTIKTFSSGTYGQLQYIDKEAMTANTAYKYEIISEDCVYFDKTVEVKTTTIVKPVINNGDYSNDEYILVKNEVPLNDVQNWVVKYNQSNL